MIRKYTIQLGRIEQAVKWYSRVASNMYQESIYDCIGSKRILYTLQDFLHGWIKYYNHSDEREGKTQSNSSDSSYAPTNFTIPLTLMIVPKSMSLHYLEQ